VTIRAHRLDTLEPAGPELSGSGPVMDAAFAPDGADWVVIARSTTSARGYEDPPEGSSGTIEFRDFRTGALIGESLALGFEPRSLDVRPDGSRVAVYGTHSNLIEIGVKDHSIHILSVDPGDRYDHANGFCRYSPDGRMLLAWGMERPGIAWDTATNQRIATPHSESAKLVGLDFHGQTAVGASIAARLDFLALPGCQPAAPPVQETNWLFLSRFSPEGDLVLTAGRGRIARLWDWRKGVTHGAAMQHDDEVFAGAFIPGSRAVVTGGSDGSIRFWDRDTGQPLREPVKSAGRVMSLAVAPDRRTLVVADCDTGVLELYDLAALLPRPELSPEDALLLAEIDASAEIESGAIAPLSSTKWLEKWRLFRSRHPEWER